MPILGLMDSGFLYALYDAADRHHAVVVAVRRTQGLRTIVPDIVLVEAAFLARRSRGIPGVLRLLDSFQQAVFPLEMMTRQDLQRVREIMAKYQDSEFDFVDCCLMALAERLGITRIYTIDQRDFRIFRPRHCDHFDLLP